jgi:S-methylmethionine-dependent homocysteine/selenocysteine methylase
MLGYDEAQLDAVNRRAIALMEELRADAGAADREIVISGCVGPHDDGYDPSVMLTADAARAYHATQVGTFADTAADLVAAITMTYAEEAIGVTRAAADAGLPAVISFTVETDGRLPSGQALGDAIEQVDAETDTGPAYFLLNCAHTGDPADLGARYAALREPLPRLNILGGCCGTDDRHIAEIARAWGDDRRPRAY